MIGIGLLWRLVGLLADVGSAGLLVGTAAATAALLAVMLAASILPRRAIADPSRRVTRRILRERDGRSGVPRHRDPDASGRSRPRAPTTALAVA